MRVEYSFDWKGFHFFIKFLVVCFGAGIIWNYGLPLAVSHFAPAQPAPIQTQETSPVATVAIAALSDPSTPKRVINSLTIEEAVPKEGKFIAVDLEKMKLYLYQDGKITATFPIVTKGKPETPWETPSGFYSVLTKEVTHFSSIGKVYMPYSLQFYGNYFIHGWTYYPNGTPTSASFSGGCIKLATADAKEVFAFADKGTGIFVYDKKETVPKSAVVLTDLPIPPVSAGSYLIADIDTGDVYLERRAKEPRPIASVTKLMTALVANEVVSFDKNVSVARGVLLHPKNPNDTARETFLIGDLFYPLLMESNNAVADAIARYYDITDFVEQMNTTAKALDMQSTRFADASGISSENTATPDDLFRLAAYLANKKSFVLKITGTPKKEIISRGGERYRFSNFNVFFDSTNFVGGKVGHTTIAQDTMLSVFSLPVNGEERRIAIVVLGSTDYTTDTKNLVAWFAETAEQGNNLSGTSCVSCAKIKKHRKIELP